MMARAFKGINFFFFLNIKLEASRWLWHSHGRSRERKSTWWGCPYVSFQFAVTHLEGFENSKEAGDRRSHHHNHHYPFPNPATPISLIPNEVGPLLLRVTSSFKGTFLPGGMRASGETSDTPAPTHPQRVPRNPFKRTGGRGGGGAYGGEVKNEQEKGQLLHSYHGRHMGGEKNEEKERKEIKRTRARRIKSEGERDGDRKGPTT